MEFEWSPAKSRANFEKHGVSFEDALELWTGRTIDLAEVARSQDGEDRGATIGVIGAEIYTAIWTIRGQSIRLISVRRAREYEAKGYRKKVGEKAQD